MEEISKMGQNSKLTKINVDFDAKDAARAQGAKVVPSGWVSKKGKDIHSPLSDEEKAKQLEQKNNINKIAKRMFASDALEEDNVFHLDEMENCFCNKEDEEKWNTLLDFRNWNALEAVLLIKKSGLSRSEKNREKMLSYFAQEASFKKGEQYHVSYKELCDYCSSFEKMYSFERIVLLQRKHKINGFNFESSVNKSGMTGEEKELFKFVFPLSIKTEVREMVKVPSEPVSCVEEHEMEEVL